jgi:hypothetical protein
MATDTSRLGLGTLIVRALRIKLARIVMKLATGLTMVASAYCRRTCASRDSGRLEFQIMSRRHQPTVA